MHMDSIKALAVPWHLHHIRIQPSIIPTSLTSNMKRSDSTGKLFCIALRCMQQSIGFVKPFYNKRFSSYEHFLPHSWLKQLFQYLHSRQVTVELSDDITLSLPRKGDASINEILFKHFTTSQMKILNCYRISLQVMYLSEITDISGRSILPNIREGTNYRTSSWKWSKEQSPIGYDKIWKHACGVMQSHLRTHCLGSWIETTQTWDWKSSNDLSRANNN